jgi:hypothetical protein
MAALTRSPENTNLLQPTKYLLIFDRIPTTQYFCQSANIPGVSLGQAEFNTPLLDIPIAGNKMSYEHFNISFTIDENMISWRNIYDWFRAIASPKSIDERNRLNKLQNNYKSSSLINYSDATLTILSALNNPIARLKFYNMFPVSLSDIDFDVKNSADDIITAQASFRYEYFEFEQA